MRTSFLLPALVAALAVPVSAQSLPDWATPVPPQKTPGPTEQMVPGAPGEPSAVPLDGGLALLALAGGAYAVRRLRSE